MFTIKEYNRLYYLKTVNSDDSFNDMTCCDNVNPTCDVKTWHEILGNCKVNDVLKLPEVVEGMKITGDTKLECNVCTEGKFTNSDQKASEPLELVHTDLAGPIEPISQSGHKYAKSFTDDFSEAVSVYFLKHKSEATMATEKFLADCAPYGIIKCIRSDNGTEFMSSAFQTLLREKGIKHETSAPYSPHQNGTAERQWRTLVEMGRCLLLEKGLPKALWPYAIQNAAHIRNRCYKNRTKSTPYQMLTGKRPDLPKLWIFGSECYAYSHDHKNLDPRCERAIYVGYSKIAQLTWSITATQEKCQSIDW